MSTARASYGCSRRRSSAMDSRVGVMPEKEVVVCCQMYRRSARTWFVLKSLGFSPLPR